MSPLVGVGRVCVSTCGCGEGVSPLVGVGRMGCVSTCGCGEDGVCVHLWVWGLDVCVHFNVWLWWREVTVCVCIDRSLNNCGCS